MSDLQWLLGELRKLADDARDAQDRAESAAANSSDLLTRANVEIGYMRGEMTAVAGKLDALVDVLTTKGLES